MAASSLVPKNGAIAYGAYIADFASFDIDGSQAVDNVTPYGTNNVSKNVGSGTPTFTFNVGAFALAHATGTPPVLSNATTNSMFGANGAASGATSTFTLDTGVTEACVAITERVRISHARMRGYVPVAITARNAGEITETWAVA